ncbi:MAG: prenyltransferase/squalene oxidase repeat-containing protein, partial [Planctomycetota bacterium]
GAARNLHQQLVRQNLDNQDAARRMHAEIRRCAKNERRGLRYLHKTQRQDGSWLPLWFGNHDEPDDENPFYGTGRILLAAELGIAPAAIQRAVSYLLSRQNPDGGWGGGPSRTRWLVDWAGHGGLADTGDLETVSHCSSVEETAVVLHGLAIVLQVALQKHVDLQKHDEPNGELSANPKLISAIMRGSQCLVDSIRERHHQHPWPIGFYFAKLWYHERVYPYVFATEALAAARGSIQSLRQK